MQATSKKTNDNQVVKEQTKKIVYIEIKKIIYIHIYIYKRTQYESKISQAL